MNSATLSFNVPCALGLGSVECSSRAGRRCQPNREHRPGRFKRSRIAPFSIDFDSEHFAGSGQELHREAWLGIRFCTFALNALPFQGT